MKYKIAIIGFGTVGQGFTEILLEKKEWIKEKYNLYCELVAISDPIKGSVYDEKGIKLEEILRIVKERGNINYYPYGIKGWESIKTITSTNANVIVEATPTNIETGEPGLTHIKVALSYGKNVITTNKGPIALAYKELIKMAKDNGVKLKFEGTVLSGTPVISLVEGIKGERIKQINGIVNGTTNFILTQMFNGKSYDEALKEAKKLGYAEADPTYDVEGYDALAKIVILGNVLMDGDIKINEVERNGITNITLDEIEKNKIEGKKYKLIATAYRDGEKIKAKVEPKKIGKEDILFHIDGVNNAITFTTDNLGNITIVGPGAGRKETGTAILNDLLSIHKENCR